MAVYYPKLWEDFLKKQLLYGQREKALLISAELGEKWTVPILEQLFYQEPEERETERIIDALRKLNAVESLCKMARDPFLPPENKRALIEVLSQLTPSPLLEEFFLEELRSPHSWRRNCALRFLGKNRIVRAVPQLIRMLRLYRGTSLFFQIAQTLFAIRAREVFRALELLFLTLKEGEQRVLLRAAESTPSSECLDFLEGLKDKFTEHPIAEEITYSISRVSDFLKRQLDKSAEQQRVSLEDGLFSQ